MTLEKLSERLAKAIAWRRSPFYPSSSTSSYDQHGHFVIQDPLPARPLQAFEPPPWLVPGAIIRGNAGASVNNTTVEEVSALMCWLRCDGGSYAADTEILARWWFPAAELDAALERHARYMGFERPPRIAEDGPWHGRRMDRRYDLPMFCEMTVRRAGAPLSICGRPFGHGGDGSEVSCDATWDTNTEERSIS